MVPPENKSILFFNSMLLIQEVCAMNLCPFIPASESLFWNEFPFVLCSCHYSYLSSEWLGLFRLIPTLILPPVLAMLRFILGSPTISFIPSLETQPLDNKPHLQVYLENGWDVKYLFLLKNVICSPGAWL